MEEKGSQNARRITQYIAALVAMGGALSAGAVFGWSSPAQYRLTNQTEYGFPIDDEQWSWVGSTITLGGNSIIYQFNVLFINIRTFFQLPFLAPS